MDVDGKMKSSEHFLVGYLNQMLSTLLVVPVSFLARTLKVALTEKISKFKFNIIHITLVTYINV